MCHQTGCLIARDLEANGISTVVIGSALDILEAGNAPRSVFVDYPLAIVRDALAAFESITNAGEIKHLNYHWSDSDAWKTEASDTKGGDTRAPRDLSPQYQTDADRIAAEQR